MISNYLSGNDAIMIGRNNEVWRTQYMREWAALQDAKDEGLEEGKFLAYLDMVNNGDISIEKAASRLGVTPEEFKKKMDEALSVV